MSAHRYPLAAAIFLVVAGALLWPQPAQAVYPNPFHDGTTFQLSMPKAASIRIEVFDMLGRHVKVLFEGVHPEGEYPVPWDGKDDSGAPVAPGIYICVLFSDGVAVKSVKVVKIRFQ